MRLVVVGVGGTTRELLLRLGEMWECILVDPDPVALGQVAGLPRVETHLGDGSSALVLDRAGIREADAVVAATDDDEVNLEVCRLAAEAGIDRIVAVAAEPERIADYRALGVVALSPEAVAARRIEVLLEPRRVVSTAFADGKAEAIEFSISPDASVRDRQLKDLHSKTWIVAAILRNGELIVPHGDTRLRAGDRVTVVGAASDFGAIVRTFTTGEARFPLGHGRKVAVVLDSPADLEGPVAEAMSIVRNSPAEELLVVHRDPDTDRDTDRRNAVGALLDRLREDAEGVEVTLAPERPPLRDGLLRRVRSESVGLVVVPAPTGKARRGRFSVGRLVGAFATTGKPVLVSRGTHPYRTIVVPARRTRAGEAAARVGLDLARSFDGTVVGVAAVAPTFVGQTDLDDARRAAAWLREEAAVQGIAVRRRIRRGNPVHVLQEAADAADLLVLALPGGGGSLRPRIAAHLVRRAGVSVLLVPEPR